MWSAIANQNLEELLPELNRAGFDASDGSYRNDTTPSADVDIPGSSEYIKVWVPDEDGAYEKSSFYVVQFDGLDEYFDERYVKTIDESGFNSAVSERIFEAIRILE